MQIKENILLAPYTAFKIGGPARFFCETESREELKEAMLWARSKSLPVFILGGGSNIVVADEGWPGLVIKNAIVRNLVSDNGNVIAGAGESWDKFVEFAVSRNLAGVECLSGIPGTVGAAPVQNIGAYGQSAAETIESVFAIDLQTNEEIILQKKDCGFGYRTSKFSAKDGEQGSPSGGKQDPNRYAIIFVKFSLKPHGEPKLVYHELKNRFAGAERSPSLQEVRKAVLAIRSKKGMVATGEELHSSVGSFFTNPIIASDALENIKSVVEKCKKTKNCCADPWFWPKPDGNVKISAACLIECAGFEKGMRVGNVGISPLHSLAIINLGGATATEAMSFANDIINKVQSKFGVTLNIEPQLVGF